MTNQDHAAPRLRSMDDTRRILGISRTTLYKLVDEGQLKQVKIGRRALITNESINVFITELSAP